MKTDVLVIGAGTAGLCAAVRLAQAGRRVQVIATGAGSLGLAPATIDVLGYAPEPVEDPLGTLPAFVAAHPGHPYALMGPERVAPALAWLSAVAGDLGYPGTLSRNRLLPTALGALRPAGLLPESMSAGALEAGARVVIASFNGYRDFYPHIVAANLSAGSLALDARPVDLVWEGELPDLAPQRLWRRMEEPEVRARVARSLRPLLDGEVAVGFPAILGREHGGDVRRDLEERLERPVFEIPTLPPSLPGLRLYDLLRAALRRAGGRLTLGETATGFRARGGRLEAVLASQPPREDEYLAQAVVLASGGVSAGGIEVDSEHRAREPVFDLPLSELPQDSAEWFQEEYFGEHGFDRAGVAVDALSRPLRADGEPVFENLFLAGAELAGASPWREKSGEGISLVTALRAAEAALEVCA